MNTEVYDSLGGVARAAADSFINSLDDSNISIVVPGGNTPKNFFHILAHTNVDWKKICLILSDERMVSANHQASNYGMIKETLLNKLPEKNKPMVIPDMDYFIEENSEKFLDETNFLLNEKLPIKHAFLGLGSDGHTASLFQGNKMDSTDDDPFFYAIKSGEPYQRMTLSMKFLQSIPLITFIISGNSKRSPLKAILESDVTETKSPAQQLLDTAKGQVNILCDQQACNRKLYA